MTGIDPAIVEAVAQGICQLIPEDGTDCPCDDYAEAVAPLIADALTAALAERDAARAEVARLRAAVERAFATTGFVPEPVLSDAHARYHDQPGNLMGKDECGWDCDFFEVAVFVRDHLCAALAAIEDQP